MKKQQFGGESRRLSMTECETHPSMSVQAFCLKCDCLVCMNCITSQSHQKHNFSKIEDLSENKERELKEVLKESRAQLQNLRETQSNLTELKNQHLENLTETTRKIENRNKHLKQQLDSVMKKRIQQLQKVTKDNFNEIEQVENCVSEGLSALGHTVAKSETNMNQSTVELIKSIQEIRRIVCKYPKCHQNDVIVSGLPCFITSEDTEKLEDMFGHLQVQDFLKKNSKSPAKVISAFHVQNKNLVAVVNDNLVWLATSEEREITQTSKTGNLIKTTKTGFAINDIAVNSSGELLMSVSGTDLIKKFTKDEKFVNVYQIPAGYTAQGLTVMDDDQIVVCLYQLFEDSSLAKLDQNGKLLKLIQYDTDGKTPLFENPERVCSNRNGDLIVTQPFKNVTILDNQGKKRCEYSSQVQGLQKPFNPQCTVTDKLSHILVSDYDNSTVHLLDKSGQFLQFLQPQTEHISHPKGMCLDETNKLWICSENGNKILVVQYL